MSMSIIEDSIMSVELLGPHATTPSQETSVRGLIMYTGKAAVTANN